MIGGVVFQLIAMTAFTLVAVEFMRLSRAQRPVLVAMFVAHVAVYTRSIFHTIELAKGWTGYLMLHERYFLALDGALMVLDVGILVLFDPSRVFSGI
ncbi:RTA1 like protein-domain-containing protein [Apiospora rasikravindrae]|uniref:RTA1 like protein-domain-containing protein n=1 Tax=Apiospora rasikravindrae TaxID=990691 RepID=A0ABR1U7S3_9PEZI